MNPPKVPRLVQASEEGVRKVKVRADVERLMRAEAEIREKLAKMSRGELHPDQVRKDLLRRYYRGLMTAGGPGASSVKGHKWATVIYRFDGDDVYLDWEWLPGPDGRPMVLGFCPKCYQIAPTTADVRNATTPIFLENQLARIKGDPDADMKFVPFRIESSTHHMEMDEFGRLSIREPVHCPDRRRCSWSVRVVDGVAHRIERRLSRAQSYAPGGRLVLPGDKK